jgi:hypothetical protein
MFCPNCGKVLEEGAYFCPDCGERITAVSQAPSFPVKKDYKNLSFVIVSIYLAYNGIFTVLLSSLGSILTYGITVLGNAIGGAFQSYSGVRIGNKFDDFINAIFLSLLLWYGIGLIAAAYGTWRLFRWGRVLAVVLLGISIVLNFSLFTIDQIRQSTFLTFSLLIIIIVNIFIISYLSRAKTIKLFQ